MSPAERRLVQVRLAEDAGEADQNSSEATCVSDLPLLGLLLQSKMYDDRLFPAEFSMVSSSLSATSRFGFSCSSAVLKPLVLALAISFPRESSMSTILCDAHHIHIPA